MNLHNKKGFTLIELLVVISIIGILGSIVLASLSDARGKGNTAAIKSTLVNVRTQAELVYSDDYSFAAVCADPVIINAIAEAEDLNGGTAVVCNDDTRDWAIASVTPDGAFCVDADGSAKEYANLTAAITGTNPNCN